MGQFSLLVDTSGAPITMKRILSAVIVFFLAFAMLIETSPAQETRATLSGTVTDASGGAIANAKLQLTNINTGTTANSTTNGVGEYRFLFIDPGSYRLTADASGFQKYVENGVTLTVSQASTVDIKMTIGSESQTVNVTSDQPLLETEKADRGVVLTQRSLEELPISVRNPIVLVEIIPGVTQVTQRYDLLPFTNNGNSGYSINGLNGDATENLLDGAPNDMIYQALNSIAYIPSVDAVAEFKTITAPYDAQYGRNGGGVISVVTKNGTNKFHGTAYDFVERTFLDANSWSNNAIGAQRSNQSLDEYGGTLGGPVWIPHLYKGIDKTFFFAGWEGYKENINLVTGVSVPTALQRMGDFSQTFNSNGQLITIYNPKSGRLVNGVWTRDPYPGNKIPQGDIDPTGQALANSYPLPNTNQNAVVNWQNNFLGANITNYSFNNVIARVDHTFSEREKVYVRYAWNKAYLHQNSNDLPTVALDDRYGTKSNNDIVADSVTVLTPNIVFDMKASVVRWVQNLLPQAYGTFNGTQIGLPASTVSQFQSPSRFPYVTVSGYQYLGSSSGNIDFAPTTAITAEPTLIFTKGRQTIKTGFDYRWTRWTDFSGAYGGGTFGVTPGFTQQNYLTADAASGNSIASMLVGGAATGEVDTLPHPYWSLKYYGMWVQDDIKLTSRLTVNAGLRYDLQSPIIERHNILGRGFSFGAVNPISSQINHAAYTGDVFGGLGFVGVGGNPRSPFDTDYNNIQPRLGAAFRVTNGFVLRGGWGIFYIPQVSTASNNGFSQITPYVGTLNNGETIANPLSNPFPTGVLPAPGSSQGLATLNGSAPSFSDTSGQIGHVQSFSFGFQKQLPAQMTVDMSYVGTRSNQLPVSVNIDALAAPILAKGNTDLGGASSYLTTQVPNPFQGLLQSSSLNSATISRQQLLLPFPQYTSVTENNIPIGKNWYNAFQMTLQQRTWHGLDMTIAYTFSKNLQATSYLNPEDAASAATAAGGPPTASAYADDQLAPPTHSFTPYDRTHRFVFAPVYELPFGKGRLFFTNNNRFVNTLISGWQAAGDISWQTGAPMTAPTGVYLVGNPNVPNRSYTHMFNSGTIGLNGAISNAVDGLAPAWRVQPAFSLRNVPLTLGNVRDQWGTESHLTAAKNNYFHETMNLQLRFEFLNAFNHPIFGGDPVVSYTSPQFGSLIRSNGQTNVPRTIQLAARLVF
jgi:hypothetical protein